MGGDIVGLYCESAAVRSFIHSLRRLRSAKKWQLRASDVGKLNSEDSIKQKEAGFLLTAKKSVNAECGPRIPLPLGRRPALLPLISLDRHRISGERFTLYLMTYRLLL